MRKERNSSASKEFWDTSGKSAARQSACSRASLGQTDDVQLRGSRRIWTSGVPASPGGAFRLVGLKKTRNIVTALKRASVLGLFILSIGSAAASQRTSPGRLEQGAASSTTAFDISGVVLDPSDAAIAGAKVILHGRNLENEPSTSTDLAGHFQFSGVTPHTYDVYVHQNRFHISKSRVKVGPHPLAPLRIVLPLAELHEEVTATDSQGQLRSEATEAADILQLDREAL